MAGGQSPGSEHDLWVTAHGKALLRALPTL